MKKATLITLAVMAACALGSCGSNQTDTNAGADSVRTELTPPNNNDTARVTNALGEATTVESGGSGGTMIAKDTSLKKTGTDYAAPKTVPTGASGKDSIKAPVDTAKGKKK